MPFICIGPVCIPWAAIWPILLLILKPVWSFLKPHAQKVPWMKKWVDYLDPEEDEDPVELVELSAKQVSELTSKVTRVGTLEEWGTWMSQATSANLPVLVKFTADWCKPCKKMDPVLHRLFKESGGSIVFLEVDFDKSPQIRKRCKVRTLPTFQVYRSFEKISEIVGAYEDQLESLVRKVSEEQKLVKEVCGLDSSSCFGPENKGDLGAEGDKYIPTLEWNDEKLAVVTSEKAQLIFLKNKHDRVIAVGKDASGLQWKSRKGTQVTAFAYYGDKVGLWKSS
mmetsp:Transcript_14472/g.28500  ORF Transcript_14472/g.28500 Transcript_14472/m.28500 type:complete len:281 (+) Transcript_14472:32-874(+)